MANWPPKLAPSGSGPPHESPHISEPQPPSAALPVTRCILSPQEWEDLKPAIRRLYVEENLTFRRTAQVLSEEYGFLPTKRQFDIRVNKWGFKKNASKDERDSIVQSQGTRNIIGSNGRVVKRSTRDRWEREMKRQRKSGGKVGSSSKAGMYISR